MTGGDDLAAGFVTYPGGSYKELPSSPFQLVSDGNLTRTSVKPYLYGGRLFRGATFTRRYGRWLPADLAAVSPDSSHYAYAEPYGVPKSPRSRIHVVDVASSSDRVVYDQGYYSVMDYENEGIYVFATGYNDGPNRGLWRLDSRSGSLTQLVGGDQTVDLVGGGAAWYSDLAPGDQIPSYVQGLEQNFFVDRLMRVDLRTGLLTAWFRLPGKEVHAIGVDGQGDPIVMVDSSSSEELWVLPNKGSGKRIYSGPGFDSTSYFQFYGTLPDRYGVWVGSGKGVFLYRTDGRLVQISDGDAQIAGRCT